MNRKLQLIALAYESPEQLWIQVQTVQAQAAGMVWEAKNWFKQPNSHQDADLTYLINNFDALKSGILKSYNLNDPSKLQYILINTINAGMKLAGAMRNIDPAFFNANVNPYYRRFLQAASPILDHNVEAIKTRKEKAEQPPATIPVKYMGETLQAPNPARNKPTEKLPQSNPTQSLISTVDYFVSKLPASNLQNSQDPNRLKSVKMLNDNVLSQLLNTYQKLSSNPYPSKEEENQLAKIFQAFQKVQNHFGAQISDLPNVAKFQQASK